MKKRLLLASSLLTIPTLTSFVVSCSKTKTETKLKPDWNHVHVSKSGYKFNSAGDILGFTGQIDGVLEIPEILVADGDETSPYFGYEVKPREIGWYVFRKKIFLEKVIMPNTIKIIASGAFAYCYQLTEVVFSNSLERILSDAFYETGLSQVQFPETLKEISVGAFDRTKIKEVTLPSNCQYKTSSFSYMEYRPNGELTGPWDSTVKGGILVKS